MKMMWRVQNVRKGRVAFFETEHQARTARKIDPSLKYGRVDQTLQVYPERVEYGVLYQWGESVRPTILAKYIITHDPGNRIIFKNHGHFSVGAVCPDDFYARSNDFWGVFNYAVKNAIAHKLTSIEISWQLWPE